MTFFELISYAIPVIIFAFVSTCTPGPNNLMLATSSVRHGFSATFPHRLGIIFGFTFMILMIGLGLGEVFSQFPFLHDILKIAGSGFLIYLSYRLFMPKKNTHNSTEIDAPKHKPFSFIESALFQWINPKAWLMATTASATYIDPTHHYHLQLSVIVISFFILSWVSTSLWAGLGVLMKSWLEQNETRLKIFNIVMALLILSSLIPVWL